MKKLSNCIESLDMFAHPVALNFNKRGSVHGTAIGGCISILIRMALVGYVAILLIRLINKESNSNETNINVEEEMSTSFGESNLKVMINIFD